MNDYFYWHLKIDTSSSNITKAKAVTIQASPQSSANTAQWHRIYH